jgi:hypothetical protein
MRERRRLRESKKLQQSQREVGWSDERLAMFKRLIVEYRREPSIENYLRVRLQFLEVEIQVGHFAGIDPLFALENELRKQGVESQLVAAALDGDEPSIDALSLRLMQCLVAREKLPRDGPGYIQRHRDAISDAMVRQKKTWTV